MKRLVPLLSRLRLAFVFPKICPPLPVTIGLKGKRFRMVGTKTGSPWASIALIVLVAFLLIGLTIWVFEQRLSHIEKTLSAPGTETKEPVEVHR